VRIVRVPDFHPSERALDALVDLLAASDRLPCHVVAPPPAARLLIAGINLSEA